MPLDMSIYQNLLAKPPSVADFDNQAMQVQQNKLALQAGQQKVDETQRGIDSEAALSRALASGSSPADVQNKLAQQGYGKQALAYAQQQQALLKGQSDISKNNSETGLNNSKTATGDYALREQKRQKAISDITSFKTPEEAMASLQQHVKAGDVDPAQAQMIAASMPQTAADLPKWQAGMVQSILSAPDRMKYIAPTADAQLSSDTSIKTTGMNNATQVKTTGMNNATSRANNADTIDAENTRMGIGDDGKPDASMSATAKAIAAGQLPPPAGAALLNPKNQRLLSMVMEINPQYDYTTVSAKKAAATAFTTGTQGNALRSVSTANAHLDQLGELANAMNNGNAQAVNKVTNWFQTQTGNPNVTNFNAIKNIVGQEVVKAIVAGGGSAGERDEAAKSFSDASSPAQLQGAIQHYRMVMGAQASNLLAQRRAAGLPDSTLPSYTAPAPAAGLPPDIAALVNKHGGK